MKKINHSIKLFLLVPLISIWQASSAISADNETSNHKFTLPHAFKIYVKSNRASTNKIKGSKEKILPTINHYNGKDGGYALICTYDKNSEEVVYSETDKSHVIAQIRLKGNYIGDYFYPEGYKKGEKYYNDKKLIAICEQYFPKFKGKIWLAGDTGKWFGLKAIKPLKVNKVEKKDEQKKIKEKIAKKQDNTSTTNNAQQIKKKKCCICKLKKSMCQQFSHLNNKLNGINQNLNYLVQSEKKKWHYYNKYKQIWKKKHEGKYKSSDCKDKAKCKKYKGGKCYKYKSSDCKDKAKCKSGKCYKCKYKSKCYKYKSSDCKDKAKCKSGKCYKCKYKSKCYKYKSSDCKDKAKCKKYKGGKCYKYKSSDCKDKAKCKSGKCYKCKYKSKCKKYKSSDCKDKKKYKSDKCYKSKGKDKKKDCKKKAKEDPKAKNKSTKKKQLSWKDREIHGFYHLATRKGVIVNEIFKNSPAEKAGLKVKDEILKINDQELTGKSKNEIFGILNANKENTLEIQRGNKKHIITITKDKIKNFLDENGRLQRSGEAVLMPGYDYGEKIDDFEITNLKGEKKKFSELKGKNVMLVFWATWCRPCVQKINTLKKIDNEYKDKDLALISISIDRNKGKWEKFIKDNKMDWYHSIAQSEESPRNIADEWGIYYVPTIAIADKQGKLFKKVRNGSNIEEIVKKLTTIKK